MTKYFAAYVVTTMVIVALDRLWRSLVAEPLYQQGLARAMADRPNVPFIFFIYTVFALGLMLFAVAPNELEADWSNTFVAGALFGFFAYATCDLANPVKNWPIGISVRDISLGCLCSSFSAGAGKTALDWVADIEQMFILP